MASDDILFLVVFIIIPTAILVSGFWLFLFLRRGRPVPAAASDEAELEEETASDEQPTIIIDDLADDAATEIGPMTADLLAESEEPLEAELEQETIEAEILDSTGHTDEIPDIPEESFEPARIADFSESEWQPIPTVEDEKTEESAPGSVEQEAAAEIQTDESSDEPDSDSLEEAADDDEQRPAGGKLLPGRHSQGRKRRGSRRAPKLRRLRRDEDSVEGVDGSGGIDSGDSE